MLTSKNKVRDDIDIDSMMDRLKIWREERGITFMLSRKGYVANIFEELSEYCRGGDVEDKIDALADICVFSLNNIDMRIDCIVVEKSCEPFLYRFNNAFTSKYIQETYANNLNDKLNIACIELVQIAFSEIENLGFNINLVMNETVKEIESRIGYLDNTIGKFVKFEGAYTLEEALKRYEGKYASYKDLQTKWILTFHNNTTKDIIKWYKADYKQCRNA